MWQAAWQEGTILDEVVNRNAILFGFTSCCTSACLCVICVLRLVVWSWCFHGLSLVLLRQTVLFFLFFELGHVLLWHGAHRGELRADLVHFVALKRMLLADFLDFFITQHSAGLGYFIFILLFASIACHILWVFPIRTFLFNLECCPTSSILGEILGSSLTVGQSLRRSLIWLRLLVLVAISQRLLPLLSILTASKATHTSHLANLVIDLVYVDVSLELLHSSHERHLAHDNYLL